MPKDVARVLQIDNPAVSMYQVSHSFEFKFFLKA